MQVTAVDDRKARHTHISPPLHNWRFLDDDDRVRVPIVTAAMVSVGGIGLFPRT